MVTEVNPKKRQSSSKSTGTKASVEQSGENPPQTNRETVESIVVAFILAFLFRAFVAEAFVIPTGSMAPTLMGAHKDLTCEICGQPYQASASSEFDSSGALTARKTIASNCSNCRGLNEYDFVSNPNHVTFSGDRILVSKFDYVLSKPKRWDVIVFKFPQEAHMNYIKRLIGLPGETLRIAEGDVFVQQPNGTWRIARKPPHKIQAMKQLVSTTEQIPEDLVKAGWPSSWQPWTQSAGGTQWEVQWDASEWSASLPASPSEQWIRYYHKFATTEQWVDAAAGASIPIPGPTDSQLITDYAAYNTPFLVPDAKGLFNLKIPKIIFTNKGVPFQRPRWEPDEDWNGDTAWQQAGKRNRTVVDLDLENDNDGLHWVGDLTAKYKLKIGSDSGQLLLDLVEFGIHFRCSIDVSSGMATLSAIDAGEAIPVFDGQATVTGQTSIRGQGKHTVEYGNIDDQLVLWVDGKLVSFDQSTEYDGQMLRTSAERRPYWTATDPLDAAPIGLGGTSLQLEVESVEVYRDLYYIAIQNTMKTFSDFKLRTQALIDAVPDATARTQLGNIGQIISSVYRHPKWWSDSNLFSQRGELTFTLKENEYFPMGDNSAASSDARVWRKSFVEERFLLGKALLVFWPHTWNTPVPLTPNLPGMRLIR